MAKQSKKTAAEKPTKKTTAKRQEIEEQISDNNVTETIDATEVGVDMVKIEEAVNNIDATINTDELEKEIETKINDSITEIKNLANNMADFEHSKEVFGNALKENPDNAQELLKKEIEKTNALKSEVKKKISSYSGSITGWWNGMGYDM